MSWPFALSGAMGLLLLTLIMGVPVFISFLMMNLVGLMVLIGPRGFGLFANSIYESATSPTLATISIFVLMGEILFRSGSVGILFDSVDRLIGRLKGRLYVLTVILSTLFGALSGSAVAVAAMLGRSLMPVMDTRGYDRLLSASTILSGASLAPIIPPSLLAIIVGSLADVSISGLLIAGILPGIMFALLTFGYIALAIRAGRPAGELGATIAAAGQAPSARGSAILAFLRMLPFGIVIFSVMGLILLGIATPSESAATGVIGACITALVFRRFSLRMLGQSILSTVIISGGIILIICSAKLFSQLLSFSGASRGLIEMVSSLGWGPDATFLIMMMIPFILCMFIDQIAFMLLAIPIYVPIVAAMGYDPIWFWTLFLINLSVGSLTPPFGYTLFALKSASDELTTNEVFRAAWPVVGIYLFGMVILFLMPQLVTAIPRLL